MTRQLMTKKQQRSRFTFAGPAFSFNGCDYDGVSCYVTGSCDTSLHLCSDGNAITQRNLPKRSGIASWWIEHFNSRCIQNLVTISCTLVLGFSLRSSHTSHQQQFLRSRSLCCKVNQSMFSSSSSSHVTHHFGWVFFVDYLMKPQFSVYRNWDFCLTVSVNLCLQQKLVIWSFNPQFASYQRSSKKQLTLWSRASDSSVASPTHI